MAEQGLFLQNVIALIWDFDRTLSPHFMQAPLFEAYDIDEQRFWKEVNALPAYYQRAGVSVQSDTCYLGHLLSYVQAGRMPDLTNARLRELGGNIRLFPGLPGFFSQLQDLMQEHAFAEGDLHIEHYVVSTGLKEMILGSPLAPYIEGVWASEFIEVPAGPGTDLEATPPSGPISQIAGLLDNTTKTRALFEINKGVNKQPSIKVNTTIPEGERRVPFRNMVYIADGPSDIPSFSVVKRMGGWTYAVYDPADQRQFEQVLRLHDEGRVHDYGPADYSESGETARWLRYRVRTIADRILQERASATASKVGSEPGYHRE